MRVPYARILSLREIFVVVQRCFKSHNVLEAIYLQLRAVSSFQQAFSHFSVDDIVSFSDFHFLSFETKKIFGTLEPRTYFVTIAVAAVPNR